MASNALKGRLAVSLMIPLDLAGATWGECESGLS